MPWNFEHRYQSINLCQSFHRVDSVHSVVAFSLEKAPASRSVILRRCHGHGLFLAFQHFFVYRGFLPMQFLLNFCKDVPLFSSLYPRTCFCSSISAIFILLKPSNAAAAILPFGQFSAFELFSYFNVKKSCLNCSKFLCHRTIQNVICHA